MFNKFNLLVSGLILFAVGCQETPLERKADQVRDQSQQQADNVRESTQEQADAIRENAKRHSENNEARADQVEEKGERTADAIEEQGERVADDIEAIDDYWRDHYSSRPYIKSNSPYSTYRDAYLFGYQAKTKHAGKTFEQVEADLKREWEQNRTDFQMTWEEAKEAVRDAWETDYKNQ